MALIVYRRHTVECAAKLEKKGIAGDKARFYRGCRCPCWYGGTDATGREHPRQSLKVNDWNDADTIVGQKWQQSVTGEAAASRISVADALAKWIEAKTAKQRAENTLISYVGTQHQLLRFCAERKIERLIELTPDVLADYQATWRNDLPGKRKGDPLTTGSTRARILRLRAFLKFCLSRKWIREDPGTSLEMPEWTHEDLERTGQPLSDDEIARFHAAISARGDLRNGDRVAPSGISSTLLVFVRFLEQTGLRISDALVFEPKLLVAAAEGDLYSSTIRQKKTKAPVIVLLRSALVEEINAMTWASERYPFWDGWRDLTYVRQAVELQFRHLGAEVGIEDLRPHRLRDTFAVTLLLKGVGIEIVSMLLGHADIATTQRHYLKWWRQAWSREGMIRAVAQAFSAAR